MDSGNEQPDDTAPDEKREGPESKEQHLLSRLYAPDVPTDMEVFAGPLHWPTVPAIDFAAELSELRGWVEQLVERFPHLDHTIIPACWWRHNGHVEALQALRDHERVAYADSSPGTAGVDWHRAFLVIESRLRDWTSWAGCANGHREPIAQLRIINPAEWDEHIRREKQRRRSGKVTTSTG